MLLRGSPVPSAALYYRARTSCFLNKNLKRVRCSHVKSSNGTQPCLFYDHHDSLIPYEQGWQWQKDQMKLSAESAEHGTDIDALFMLQHQPVYTLGASSTEANLLFDPAFPPLPLHRTERGGEVTYHGPGQIVLYPVLNLKRHDPDLHKYMRDLEQVVILALAAASGIQATRVEGLTGVWVGNNKLAAIGVRARKWITYHGVALNVTTDLSPYKAIVPCGIVGRGVGSVKQEIQRRNGGSERVGTDSPSGSRSWNPVPEDARLLSSYKIALLDAFSEVFDVDFVSADVSTLSTAGVLV